MAGRRFSSGCSSPRTHSSLPASISTGTRPKCSSPDQRTARQRCSPLMIFNSRLGAQLKFPGIKSLLSVGSLYLFFILFAEYLNEISEVSLDFLELFRPYDGTELCYKDIQLDLARSSQQPEK